MSLLRVMSLCRVIVLTGNHFKRVSRTPCLKVPRFPAEPVWIYYGTGRVKTYHRIFRYRTQISNLFVYLDCQSVLFWKGSFWTISILSAFTDWRHGTSLSSFQIRWHWLILMTSHAWHLPCQPEDAEYSYTGLPCPNLILCSKSSGHLKPCRPWWPRVWI